MGAIADFTKAIEIMPTYSLYINRGMAKHKLGDYEGAIADFTKGSKETMPNNDNAYQYKGMSKYASQAFLADGFG